MKKIILITLFIISSIGSVYAQEYYIELKNGYKTTTNKLRYVNNYKTIVFQDVNGIHKEKKNNIKIIKPTKLSKDEFVYNQLGLTPFVVQKFDSIPKEKLYKLVKNWIKETYKNPEKVIKAEIDNRKIRFEGFTNSDISVNAMGKVYGSYTYTIVISVKDNKYKFEPVNLGSPIQNYSIPLNDGSIYYNKIGIPKSMYKDFVIQIGDLFNRLNNGLKEYILKNLNSNNEDEDNW